MGNFAKLRWMQSIFLNRRAVYSNVHKQRKQKNSSKTASIVEIKMSGTIMAVGKTSSHSTLCYRWAPYVRRQDLRQGQLPKCL